jgi:hypothetical protein
MAEAVGQQGHDREQAEQAGRGAGDGLVGPLPLGLDAEVVAGLSEGDLNGLIANDKFCLIRPLRLDLSWLRSRSRLKRPAPPNLPCEASPHGAEHAAAAHLAGPAHRRAGGDRSAALGPGLSASPSMGDDAATYASRGDAARDPAGDVSCG